MIYRREYYWPYNCFLQMICYEKKQLIKCVHVKRLNHKRKVFRNNFKCEQSLIKLLWGGVEKCNSVSPISYKLLSQKIYHNIYQKVKSNFSQKLLHMFEPSLHAETYL